MTAYRVERTPFGVLVFGELPVSEMVALMKGWTSQGLTVMVPGIASALGAVLAVASPGDAKKWRAAVDRAAKTKDPELSWLLGSDTGMSSLTIFFVLARPELAARALQRPYCVLSVPWDPDDFGRCYRLLKAIPEWRERLSEVSARYPQWGPLVREWTRLERLYEQEAPKGKAPRLYETMKVVLCEGGAR